MGCRCSLHTQNADLIAGCSSFHNFKVLRMAPWESICSPRTHFCLAPLRPYAIRMERVTKSLDRPSSETVAGSAILLFSSAPPHSAPLLLKCVEEKHIRGISAAAISHSWKRQTRSGFFATFSVHQSIRFERAFHDLHVPIHYVHSRFWSELRCGFGTGRVRSSESGRASSFCCSVTLRSGNGASRATGGRDGWTGRLKFLPYHHSHESHRALSGILSHTRQSLIYRVLTRHSLILPSLLLLCSVYCWGF